MMEFSQEDPLLIRSIICDFFLPRNCWKWKELVHVPLGMLEAFLPKFKAFFASAYMQAVSAELLAHSI